MYCENCGAELQDPNQPFRLAMLLEQILVLVYGEEIWGKKVLNKMKKG